MIAKSRVGWIVAGWAPAADTSDSSVRFHSTTTLPAPALGPAGPAACAGPVSDAAPMVAVAASAMASLAGREIGARRGLLGVFGEG